MASDLLENAEGDLRVALVMFRGQADRKKAENALSDAAFVVDAAVSKIKDSNI